MRGEYEIQELEARIEALEAALRSIANKCPATSDMTLAHEMAEEAEAALLLEIPGCDDVSKAMPVRPETSVLGSPPGGSGADNPTTNRIPDKPAD